MQCHADAETHLRRADPVMGRLIEAHGPCALAPDTRYFARLVGAIIGQQISVRAAGSIRRRLAELMPGGEVHPQGILAAGEEDLRGAGLSRPKGSYIRDLADRVAAGTVDLHRIAKEPDEDVIAELVQVKGIGRWTAEMFLIFSLGRPDVLPLDDLGFRTAVTRAYALEALPGKAALEAIAAPWRPYASIAAWYLWRSLDNVPQAGAPGPFGG